MPEQTELPIRSAQGAPQPWHKLENAVAVGLLVLIALLPLAECVGRLFGVGNLIPGSIPLVQHFTLLTAIVGGALAARSGRLLALSTATFLPLSLKEPARILTAMLGIAVCGCLAYASWTFAMVERDAGDILAFGLPIWLFILPMAFGFAAIGLRMAWNSSGRVFGRVLALSGVLIPIALASWEMLGELPLLPWGLALLFGGALLGLPIFTVIGGLAALLFWYEYTPVTAVPLAAYQLSGQPLLPAIPLFTLGGYILSEGGASRRLVRVFSALVGWLPGGLAVTTAVAFAFFTSFTGASGVTILTLGGLLLPVLLGAGYPRQFSLGLMTASSPPPAKSLR